MREETKKIVWYSMNEEPKFPYAKVLVRLKEKGDKFRYYIFAWVNQHGLKGFFLNGQPICSTQKHSVSFDIEIAEYTYLTGMVDGKVIETF